ncbi:MAG TPA: quinone-dependent dihydroorotate dehydrogenase [Candidatus Limnocylindria bacterium]|nr:quinone-dependent dihydroorotate dehydrogenase [Candidatus Limnocylindria bacterium]
MGWQRDLYEGLRPLVFSADSEWIHDMTLASVRKVAEGSYGRTLLSHLAADGTEGTWAARPVEHMRLRFRNPVGLAAGFDKNAEALPGWAALGYGFAEVGTVTPMAQAGNPRPRVWRLADDGALVNRMGFNNAGAAAVAERVERARAWLPADFVVGVSIGRGAATADDAAEEDYLAAAATIAPITDYLAVNVSSPNTAGLAALQEPDRLAALVVELDAVEPQRPLVVKLPPDQPPDGLRRLVDALGTTPAAGLILSNTSRSREGLRSPLPPGADEGGLSGRPLLADMLTAIGVVKADAGDRFTLIASGGIFSGDDARRARDAGADLVQLWTGMVYAGPGLIGEVVKALTSASI